MALARGGWAVLLTEGTLQEQLREREGRQAVAAGVAARDPGSVTRYNLFRQRRGRLEPPPPARCTTTGPRPHTMIVASCKVSACVVLVTSAQHITGREPGCNM